MFFSKAVIISALLFSGYCHQVLIECGNDIEDCKQKCDQSDAKLIQLGDKTYVKCESSEEPDTDGATGKPKAGRNRHPKGHKVFEDMRVEKFQSTIPALWGMLRLNKPTLPFTSDYNMGPFRGANVDVYVLDTGIKTDHFDFGGRAIWGYNAVGDGVNTDCDGHGTHCAGTIMGNILGVANQSTAFAVKVLGCDGSGSISGIIDGINWVIRNKRAGRKQVISMSLGGGAHSLLDQAVQTAIDNGIPVVVAAGNDGRDAKYYSPARAVNAITVGASTPWDDRAYFSNFGTSLDLFAPGLNIESCDLNQRSVFMSGTSMACPHVSGVVAQILTKFPSYTPAQVRTALDTLTAKNVLTARANRNAGLYGIGTGSPNKLLQSLRA